MRKTLVLIFALAGVAAFAYPVRDGVATHNLPYEGQEEPVYENLWYWPVRTSTLGPAAPSYARNYAFDCWYSCIASNGYTNKYDPAIFTEDSLTSPQHTSGYYIGRLLPLDRGVYQLGWHQDGNSDVAVTKYIWTGTAWRFEKFLAGLRSSEPGHYNLVFPLDEDGCAVALLFTAYYYAPSGTEVTFSDIELYNLE